MPNVRRWDPHARRYQEVGPSRPVHPGVVPDSGGAADDAPTFGTSQGPGKPTSPELGRDRYISGDGMAGPELAEVALCYQGRKRRFAPDIPWAHDSGRARPAFGIADLDLAKSDDAGA